MKKLLVLFSLLVSVFVMLQPISASASTGYVHRSGNKTLTGSGTTIKLQGVALGTHLLEEPWLMGGPENANGMTPSLTKLASLVGTAAEKQFQDDYESQFITQADFQQIAADGFNSVRVPFNAKYMNYALLDNLVNWATQSGLYVIFDMHAASCSQNPYFTSDSTDSTAQLWYVSGCKQQAINVWKTIAARYATNTTVAGYDLLNEPDGWAMSNAALVQFYRDATAAIRTVDTNHMIIVEGRSYTKDVSMFTSPIDSNLMLSIHQYASSTPNPTGQITAAITAANKMGGVPVWVGEFGLDTPANVAAQVQRFNSYAQISGWCLWTWKNELRSDNQNGLNTYVAPTSWVNLINWMTSKLGATQPTVAQAQQGMNDLLNAIPNTSLNTGLLQALRG